VISQIERILIHAKSSSSLQLLAPVTS
jgi:hypothetical protein